ncbi:hypothetical protein GCM10010082_08630 [Kushneria pakistanensis]|uniref:Uncharacterized protein n=1 Tax=Kushneria pakistanensis TaxID=1508770 RepID=A0ABQ3FD80_9GAMM|nr:hypothetical protein GCM10010082_08630 [Kushneria pakistanensis]
MRQIHITVVFPDAHTNVVIDYALDGDEYFHAFLVVSDIVKLVNIAARQMRTGKPVTANRERLPAYMGTGTLQGNKSAMKKGFALGRGAT